MPLDINRVTRAFVAPSSGTFFVLASGTSGVYQIIQVSDRDENRINPSTEGTLQTTNNLLSGLNEISVAQSGLWYLSNNSFQVALSGQNLVFATPSGTWNVGITGGTYLTGTNIVSFNNNSILVGESGNWQVGLSGNNLVQVTPSGVFTVRLETGVVSTNFTNTSINVVQASSWPVNLTGTNVVTLNTGIIQANITNSNLTLNTGVLSTDLNYVKAKSYINSGLNTGLFSVKSTSGDVTDLHLLNYNNQNVFLFLYDINTTNLSLATATPLRKICVPGGFGIIDSSYDTAISCTGGISVCASLSVDTVVVTTSGLLVNIGYI